MNSGHIFATMILSWLLAYAIHSSAFLLLATLFQKLGFLKQRNFAEMVWRFALFGSLLTAVLQLPLQTPQPNTESAALQIDGNHESIRRVINTEALDANVPETIANPIDQISHITKTSPLVAIKQTPRENVIELPAVLTKVASILLSVWLLYALFVIIKTCSSILHLNRTSAMMPCIDQDVFNALLIEKPPKPFKAIHICQGTALASPFVCPNGIICLPKWVLEELDVTQCRAILMHEIRHIARHDSNWQIARQLMVEIFFFQIFNRYAAKQLSLLAEIDCDQTATRVSAPNTFVEALLRCAEVSVKSRFPAFAVPMAKNSSLLQRIKLLLDDHYMDNLQTDTALRKTSNIFFLAILILGTLAFSMPAISFGSANAIPSAQAEAMPATGKAARSTLVDTKSPQLPLSTNNAKVQTVEQHKDRAKENGTNREVELTSAALKPGSEVVNTKEDTPLEQANRAFENKEYQLAFMLYSELANKGNLEAQVATGEMLWYGVGNHSDVAAAKTWFSMAARQGHEMAKKYLDIFAERERRQNELHFYTIEFDGGKLKWTDEKCAHPLLSTSDATQRKSFEPYDNTLNPVLPSNMLSQKKINIVIQQVETSLECHNNYVLALKKSLADANYLPDDLKRIMRPNEIEKATKLAQAIYYELGMQSKVSSDQLVAQFESWYKYQTRQTPINYAAIYEIDRTNYDKSQRVPLIQEREKAFVDLPVKK